MFVYYTNMTNNLSSNISCDYECTYCNYISKRKSQYDRHLATRKHKIRTDTNIIVPNSSKIYQCECKKSFKHASSLWNHKQKCKGIILDPSTAVSNQIEPSLVIELLKQNQDFKAMLAEQHKKMAEQQDTILEISKNIGNNNNNNNTINNNNKTFNLQMFLNTDCKDAINLTDFIKTIQLEMNDMLHIGNTGYVEGISDIFIGALNKLQITERPIHCTDVRRDTLYIKENDHWDKSDAENPVLRKAIHHIDGQNQHLLPKWMEENPDSQHLDTPENIQLMKMFANSLGQGEEQSKLNQKILKKILPRVALSKESAIQE